MRSSATEHHGEGSVGRCQDRIAEAFHTFGMQTAVREAERLLEAWSDADILKASESMGPETRRVIVKMINLRRR